MVLIHDVVEIDAEIPTCYDEKAKLDKREREEKCADGFSICFLKSRRRMFALWEEFEQWRRRRPSMQLHWTESSLYC